MQYYKKEVRGNFVLLFVVCKALPKPLITQISKLTPALITQEYFCSLSVIFCFNFGRVLQTG